MPLPALVSTTTSCPWATSSATEAGRQSDAIFVDLDFFWHPDAHLFVRSALMVARAYRRAFRLVPSRDCGARAAVLVERAVTSGCARRKGCEAAVCPSLNLTT